MSKLFGDNYGVGHSMEFHIGTSRWIFGSAQMPHSSTRNSVDYCCGRLGM